MSRLLRLSSITLLLLLAADLGFACTDDDPESEGEAEANLCSDLEELQQAIVDFGGTLSLDSSVDDLRAARDDVESAFEQVRDSAGDVANVRVEEFQAAWDEFADTIEGIAEDDSIREAINTIRDAATELGNSYTEVFGGLDCP